MAKARDLKLCTVVHIRGLALELQTVPRMGVVKWSRSRDVFKFSEISDNISETVQDRDIVTMEDK